LDILTSFFCSATQFSPHCFTVYAETKFLSRRKTFLIPQEAEENLQKLPVMWENAPIIEGKLFDYSTPVSEIYIQ
jgi:hypothetical protein